MNAQSNLLSGSQQKQSTEQAQEIDLMALLGALLDRKWFIIAVTAFFMIVGVAVAVFSTPIYQATAMIQVEEKGGSVPGFDELGGMFESTSAAVTAGILGGARIVRVHDVKEIKQVVKIADKIRGYA